MEKVHSLHALSLLEDQETLVHTKDRTIVKQKGDKIHLWHEKWHSVISKEEFLNLYQDSWFYLYESSEQGIDEQKDIDYYQWATKYQ